MWSNVDVKPSQIDSRAVVYSNRAEESGKVLDSIGGDGEKYDIANDAKDVGKKKELLYKFSLGDA